MRIGDKPPFIGRMAAQLRQCGAQQGVRGDEQHAMASEHKARAALPLDIVQHGKPRRHGGFVERIDPQRPDMHDRGAAHSDLARAL